MNRGLLVRGWGGGGKGRSRVRSMRKSQFGNQEAQVFQEETEVEGMREKGQKPGEDEGRSWKAL